MKEWIKSGNITKHIEIPVSVIYSAHPAERKTMEYPGCPAHVTIDFINYPGPDELGAIVDAYADEIREACEADAREG